jgi:small subunit ribosomal protein S6e
LLSKGIGIKNIGGGHRIRKLVRGNMVTEEIYQLNCALVDGSLPVKEGGADTSKEAAKKQ